MRSIRVLALALFAAALAAPATAEAAVFNVTTTADVGDSTPDGGCANGPGGTCPLREAVHESNSPVHHPGDDVINLPPGTYSFTLAQTLAPGAQSGKLTVLGDSARDTIINGADKAAIFAVAAGASLELRELTLRDGKASASGGGIWNQGTSVLVDVALLSNEAANEGGAIDSTGTLTLDRVTLAGNKADTNGGAIDVAYTAEVTPGVATITNSTFGGNESAGGALTLSNGGDVTLVNSTVSANTATGAAEAGGLRVAGAPSSFSIANSIVHGNGPRDCKAVNGGVITSQGGNVTGDAACAAGPLADPRLGPLQDNGGQTDTFALLAGSAALDAGTAPGCPATDQRGLARPQGAACDSGAFELEVVPPPPADLTSPVITDQFATTPVFRVNSRGQAAARRRPRGTTFGFTLSEAARVSMRVERRRLGRRVRGRCRRPTARNRRARRCRRWVGVSTFHREALEGPNSVRFSGRVRVRGRARALRRGRYRLRLIAVDGAGNSSDPAFIRFRVVRRIRR
jgi:predicted outer membrane repeat protein